MYPDAKISGAQNRNCHTNRKATKRPGPRGPKASRRYVYVPPLRGYRDASSAHTRPSQSAISAPRTQATAETEPWSAATTSGSVMKGPAPTIVATLIATAERRPTPRIIRTPFAATVNELSQLLGLRDNPLGDPSTRPLAVYPPPGYDSEGSRRYPVLYCLHGYTGNVGGLVGARAWEPKAVQWIARLVGEGRMPPAIRATVDGFTRLGGSQ